MNGFRAVLLGVTLIALGLISACNKSEDPANKPATAPVTTATAAAPTEPAMERPIAYPATTQPGRILAGDLLGIEVYDLAGPGIASVFPQQVAGDGTVAPPYLARPVAVAGMTSSAASEAIAKSYEAEHLIARAQVGVRRLRVAGTGGPPPGSIGKYDLVRIAVGDLTGPGDTTVRIRRVDGEGSFDLPYIGRQKLAGLSEQQAQEVIVNVYHSQNIVQHAIVMVLRLEVAPPDAGKVDLPDVPIYAVPDALRWIYEPGDFKPSR